MPFKKQKQLAIVLMVGAILAPAVSWAEEEALQARVDRLERIIQGQGLTSLLTQVDQLQREIQRLNGANEELNHQIEQIQKRQREQYLDLDQRITEIQQQASVSQAPSVIDSPSMDNNSIDEELADGGLQNTPTDQTDAGESAPVPVAVESGEAAYQSELQDLRGGRYQEALSALGAFPQNYPNPFNPVTTIRFDIPEESHVKIDVYNVMGQKVAELVDSYFQPGFYTVNWSGINTMGSALSSGMYFYRIQARDFTAVKKLLLVK